MTMLPDINRSHNSSQLSRLEPPITMRTSPRGCIVQVDCPEFKEDEVTYKLTEDEIQLSGARSPRGQDFHLPSYFRYKVHLGFDASKVKAKSVYLDGKFSVFIPKNV